MTVIAVVSGVGVSTPVEDPGAPGVRVRLQRRAIIPFPRAGSGLVTALIHGVSVALAAAIPAAVMSVCHLGWTSVFVFRMEKRK